MVGLQEHRNQRNEGLSYGGVALPYMVRYDPDTEEWTASFEGGALYTGSLTGAIVACLDADAHALREEEDKIEDSAP